MDLLDSNNRLGLLGQATKFERGDIPKNLGLDEGEDDRGTPRINLVNTMKDNDLRTSLQRRRRTGRVMLIYSSGTEESKGAKWLITC